MYFDVFEMCNIYAAKLRRRQVRSIPFVSHERVLIIPLSGPAERLSTLFYLDRTPSVDSRFLVLVRVQPMRSLNGKSGRLTKPWLPLCRVASVWMCFWIDRHSSSQADPASINIAYWIWATKDSRPLHRASCLR